MTGAEFFMRHAGYRLLPNDKRTHDPVADAQRLFGMSLPQHMGFNLRLSSCWMVVTPMWVAASFKALPEVGFRHGLDRGEAMLDALKRDNPCLILTLGNRTLTPSDLHITYDPKFTRLCDAGFNRTIDATKEKWWAP